jgi:hypothetical protein
LDSRHIERLELGRLLTVQFAMIETGKLPIGDRPIAAVQ